MITDTPDGAVVTIHVQPKAARTEFAGMHGDALKFRVAAPPQDNAANQALCAFLAERFGVAKKEIVLQAGQASRRKRILLRGVTADQVSAAFAR
jgi:uncharacterized protein (TIGR00251 family)